MYTHMENVPVTQKIFRLQQKEKNKHDNWYNKAHTNSLAGHIADHVHKVQYRTSSEKFFSSLAIPVNRLIASYTLLVNEPHTSKSPIRFVADNVQRKLLTNMRNKAYNDDKQSIRNIATLCTCWSPSVCMCSGYPLIIASY